MRFTLHPEQWVLEFLNKAEWFFVSELPSLAAGEGFDKSIRDSAIPPPIVDAEGNAVVSEESRDWEEFVRPDIEDGFAQDREVVAQDIAGAEKTDDPEEWLEENETLPQYYEGPFWRVKVSIDHTEQWYSTLNQTRILMNKAHGLATDDSRFLFSLLGKENPGLTRERALLLAQYEFYCVIQNILVENIMN